MAPRQEQTAAILCGNRWKLGLWGEAEGPPISEKTESKKGHSPVGMVTKDLGHKVGVI